MLTQILPHNRDFATLGNVFKLWILILASNMAGTWAAGSVLAHTSMFEPGRRRNQRPQEQKRLAVLQPDRASDLVALDHLIEAQPAPRIGAGEGNRTLVFSLEGCCSTIELHPRQGSLTRPGDGLNCRGGRFRRRPALPGARRFLGTPAP